MPDFLHGVHRQLFTAAAFAALVFTTTSAAVSTGAQAAELSLPEGFTATVFHDGVGARARHIAVRANWSCWTDHKDWKRPGKPVL